jgi:hypothetical protein
VVYCEDLAAVDPNIGNRLVPGRQPQTTHL